MSRFSLVALMSAVVLSAGVSMPIAGQVPLRGAVSAAAQNVTLVGQLGGFTNTVAIQGNYAYIGSGLSLVILSLSDPSHPIVVGKAAILPEVAYGITVVGDRA
jgi:hypothetical protein